jgi:serine protease Do
MRRFNCERRIANGGLAAHRRLRTVLISSAVIAGTFLRVSAQMLPPADDAADALSRLQCSFESLVDRVGPSVVSIVVQAPPGEFHSGGSGSVIRSDGMILTSEHILDAEMPIHVTLHDGRRLRARRLAADPRSDLAVIQIDAKELTPITWGDVSSLRRGSLVVALGNPMGLADDGHAAAAFGLVSAIARPLPEMFGQDEDRYYGDMIQTSAPIGPGYSGGPLVDVSGRLVGVLTAAGRPAPAAGSGFAVPISPRTKEIIDRLLAGHDIEYGYLGVQVADAGASAAAPPPFSATLPTKQESLSAGGAALQYVAPDGPADKVGLQAGDIITEADGARIGSADQLVRLIGAAGPERRVRITYFRDGTLHECRPRLVRRMPAKAPVHAAASAGQWSFRGARLTQADPAVTRRFGASTGALIVLMVTTGSSADRAGLTPGDLIVRVNGKDVLPETGEEIEGLTDDCLLGLAHGGSVLVKGRQ